MPIKRVNLNISLTVELEQYLTRKVDSGEYQTLSEAIRDAIRLHKERDAVSDAHREQLRRDIETAFLASQDTTASTGAEVRKRLRQRRDQQGTQANGLLPH
jgi:antitoxin ParD1/3/4